MPLATRSELEPNYTLPTLSGKITVRVGEAFLAWGSDPK